MLGKGLLLIFTQILTLFSTLSQAVLYADSSRVIPGRQGLCTRQTEGDRPAGVGAFAEGWPFLCLRGCSSNGDRSRGGPLGHHCSVSGQIIFSLLAKCMTLGRHPRCTPLEIDPALLRMSKLSHNWIAMRRFQ